MPKIRHWFPEPLELDWEPAWLSPLDHSEGEEFNVYPLWWMIPRIHLHEEDLEDRTHPLWVYDLDEQSPLGIKNELARGVYIIDLAKSFGAYLEGLEYDHRKKFRYLLRKNEDIEVRLGSPKDLDLLWQDYLAHIEGLNLKQGDVPYDSEYHEIRKQFYSQPENTILSFYLGEELVAVNVSRRENGIMYDLAALVKDDQSLRARSLGSLAALKNIEWSIEQGIEKYDLLADDFGYKHRFGAKEVKLKHFIRCTEEFAKSYKLPLEFVSELIK